MCTASGSCSSRISSIAAFTSPMASLSAASAFCRRFGRICSYEHISAPEVKRPFAGTSNCSGPRRFLSCARGWRYLRLFYCTSGSSLTAADRPSSNPENGKRSRYFIVTYEVGAHFDRFVLRPLGRSIVALACSLLAGAQPLALRFPYRRYREILYRY